MPNKMERFTQRARRVLSLAQEEAERFRHNYIGTEHLLLGLMREEGGVAGRVLRDLNLEQRRVEELVWRLTRAEKLTEIPRQLDLSPGVKKVLELAVDEARRMGHHYIGTEHLLLGSIRVPEGVHLDILKRLGVSPEEVRRQTRRVLQESPVAGAPAGAAGPSVPHGFFNVPPTAERQFVDHAAAHDLRTPLTIMKTSLYLLKRVDDPEKRQRYLENLSSQIDHLEKVFDNILAMSQIYRVEPELHKQRMRILRLIEDDKITVDEATRLLSALEAPASVISVIYPALAPMIAYVFKWSGAEKRRLRVKISDKASGELKAELTASGEQIESAIINIIEAVFKAATGKMGEFEDETIRVELFIKDSEPPREGA